jgi:ubiquinone/menaquinone biosynthesis C-methylase UbiE
MGKLEFYLLRHFGLEAHHSVIDVGCGSGRLAFQLKEFLKGNYVGIDVIPELYEYAEKISGRADWRFYKAPGLAIPEPDASADYVTFFSVFTHLLHEESYKYLQEAKRVVKPGGRIIFSFLEFAVPDHWRSFKATVEDSNPNKVTNQFIGRDAIDAWAKHLGLDVIGTYDGDKPQFDIEEDVVFEGGGVMTKTGRLGQSLCVLGRPSTTV